MSQETVEVVGRVAPGVRAPLHVRESSRRTLDQRLFLRVPPLVRLHSRLFSSLRPTSRLRRALIRRAMRLGIEAFNRRDLNALLISHHPEARFEVPRELVELGVGRSPMTVREDLWRFWQEWFAAWGELRIEPREVIDLGDRAVLLGDVSARGSSSGAPLLRPYATTMIFKRGMIIRQQEFLDHGEALEAAGVSE